MLRAETGHNISNAYLLTGIGLSIALHTGFLVALSKPEFKHSPQPIIVDIVLDPILSPALSKALNRRQIVTPPSSGLTDSAPKNTNLLSDRDYKTESEQIRRGDGPSAGMELGLGKSQNRTAPNTEDKRDSRPLKHLNLDQKTMLEKFGLQKPPGPAQNADAAAQNFASVTPRPFSRASGSGARFLGAQGSSDFLPHLPDGDITLLNAKASKYAVFVRRVAIRVFARLRSSGWDLLRSGDIRSIKGFSTVRAILSTKGELLKVIVEKTSGSRSFDEVLAGAVESGAEDPHPPLDAVASDGNIHFIFKARSWGSFGPSGAHGAVTEKRWLLLATGLD